MNVLQFVVGRGTSSCEEIVKAKMAEIRRICDTRDLLIVTIFTFSLIFF